MSLLPYKKEDLMKLLKDTEVKSSQLHDSMQRLEEKVSNLEAENQVLRRQAVAISPTGKALTVRQNTPVIQCISKSTVAAKYINRVREFWCRNFLDGMYIW